MSDTILGDDTSMDDIIIWGHDAKEHDTAQRILLDKARASTLQLKKSKCLLGVWCHNDSFCMQSLRCVGDLCFKNSEILETYIYIFNKLKNKLLFRNLSFEKCIENIPKFN